MVAPLVIAFYLALNYDDPEVIRKQRITNAVNFAAQEFDLDPVILAAMVFQESSGNPCVMRYEPGFMRRYIEGKTKRQLGGLWPKELTEETERVARATSWGLLQVMGQVAREEGFREASLVELCRIKKGIHWGAKHLARHLNTFDGDYQKALLRYNGSTSYPPKVLDHIKTGKYKLVYSE